MGFCGPILCDSMGQWVGGVISNLSSTELVDFVALGNREDKMHSQMIVNNPNPIFIA